MDLYINVLEIIGTIAFAMSGAMEGIKHDLDGFGVIICGIVTATGGGIIRDIVIGQIPPQAFVNSTNVIIAIVTALLVFIITAKYKQSFLNILGRNQIIHLADNIGLATFTVIAIERCLAVYADSISLLIFIGVITGTGGGVLRDIFTDTIPTIFRKRVYAVASLLGACLFVFTYKFIGLQLSSIASILFIIAIRTLAIKYDWNIPKINL